MTETAKKSAGKRAIGICPECKYRVYIRKDGKPYKHRMPMGAEDQLCEGCRYD